MGPIIYTKENTFQVDLIFLYFIYFFIHVQKCTSLNGVFASRSCGIYRFCVFLFNAFMRSIYDCSLRCFQKVH